MNPTTSAKALTSEIASRLSSSSLIQRRQESRARFSPSLSFGRHFAPPLPSAKEAAVLVLLERREGQWTIPLTVRPKHLPDHPGQISFPGGRLEGNEDHLEAALREFTEELGTEFVGDIIGELFPIYVYNSNYHVRPFLAVSNQTLEYSPCKREVERIVHMPVKLLNDEQAHPELGFGRGSLQWKAKAVQVDIDHVWGATAIMLGDVAALLRDLV